MKIPTKLKNLAGCYLRNRYCPVEIATSGHTNHNLGTYTGVRCKIYKQQTIFGIQFCEGRGWLDLSQQYTATQRRFEHSQSIPGQTQKPSFPSLNWLFVSFKYSDIIFHYGPGTGNWWPAYLFNLARASFSNYFIKFKTFIRSSKSGVWYNVDNNSCLVLNCS